MQEKQQYIGLMTDFGYTAVAYVVPPLVIDNVKEVAFPNLTLTLNIDGWNGQLFETVNVNVEPTEGKLRS